MNKLFFIALLLLTLRCVDSQSSSQPIDQLHTNFFNAIVDDRVEDERVDGVLHRGVKHYLRQGASLEVTNEFGSKAIHQAAVWEKSKALTYLLKNGASVEQWDAQGCQPIHLAGTNEISDILLQYGANPYRPRKNDLQNAFHLAALCGQADIMESLINRTATKLVQDSSAIRKPGGRMYGVWGQVSDRQFYIFMKRNIISDINRMQDINQKTPLELVREHKREVADDGGADRATVENTFYESDQITRMLGGEPEVIDIDDLLFDDEVEEQHSDAEMDTSE